MICSVPALRAIVCGSFRTVSLPSIRYHGNANEGMMTFVPEYGGSLCRPRNDDRKRGDRCLGRRRWASLKNGAPKQLNEIMSFDKFLPPLLGDLVGNQPRIKG